MHFSIRWIFAATVYVAAASVAFGYADWVSADFLWAVSLLAFAFALLLACFARGKRQVIAAGFVIGSACFLACLTFGGSEAVPTTRLIEAVGFKGQKLTPFMQPPRPLVASPHAITPTATQITNPVYLRAANAMGMMAFGLAGCVLGALAFRGVGAKATE